MKRLTSTPIDLLALTACTLVGCIEPQNHGNHDDAFIVTSDASGTDAGIADPDATTLGNDAHVIGVDAPMVAPVDLFAIGFNATSYVEDGSLAINITPYASLNPGATMPIRTVGACSRYAYGGGVPPTVAITDPSWWSVRMGDTVLPVTVNSGGYIRINVSAPTTATPVTVEFRQPGEDVITFTAEAAPALFDLESPTIERNPPGFAGYRCTDCGAPWTFALNSRPAGYSLEVFLASPTREMNQYVQCVAEADSLSVDSSLLFGPTTRDGVESLNVTLERDARGMAGTIPYFANTRIGWTAGTYIGF